jgi:AcrR family transcriptional regulator
VIGKIIVGRNCYKEYSTLIRYTERILNMKNELKQKSVRGRRVYDSEKRAEQSEMLKVHIARSAWQLLSQVENSGDFKLEAVAKQAKVTRMTVYNLIGNRQALLALSFAQFAIDEGMDSLIQVLDEPTLFQSVQMYCSEFYCFYQKHQTALRKIRHLAAYDSELMAVIHQRDKRRLIVLNKLVLRACSEQLIKSTGVFASNARDLSPKRGSVSLTQHARILGALFSFEVFDQIAQTAGTPMRARTTFTKLIMNYLANLE